MKRALVSTMMCILVAACLSDASLEYRTCPCATGWTCCLPVVDQCVRGHEACPTQIPPSAIPPGPLLLADSDDRLRGAVCMAVDKRSVYWMNGDGSFFGMLKSGGSIESPPVTVQTLTEGTPRCGLASDGARLYATRDGTAAGLWTVPLATEGTTVFASTAGSAIALEVSPSSLAVDERFIYLTFYDDGSVRKIPKGGGAAVVLASGGVRSHAITLGDEEAYWLDLVDQEGARVMRASKDGGPSTELTRTAGDPRGWSTFGRGEMLLVAGGRAFWPEPDRRRLMALEITGAERATAPYPIAVSLPASGPLGTDGTRLFVPLASGDRTELGAIHLDGGAHETKQLGHGTITAMTFDRTAAYWIDAGHSLWTLSL